MLSSSGKHWSRYDILQSVADFVLVTQLCPEALLPMNTKNESPRCPKNIETKC